METSYVTLSTEIKRLLFRTDDRPYRLFCQHPQQPVINITEMYDRNSQGNVQQNQSQRLKRRA